MNDFKEVYYGQYCKKCKHWELNDSEDPCDECLGTPMNSDSHKPVYFEEDD